MYSVGHTVLYYDGSSVESLLGRIQPRGTDLAERSTQAYSSPNGHYCPISAKNGISLT